MRGDILRRLETLRDTEQNVERALARTSSAPLKADLVRQLEHLRAEIKATLQAQRLARSVTKRAKGEWQPVAPSMRSAR